MLPSTVGGGQSPKAIITLKPQKFNYENSSLISRLANYVNQNDTCTYTCSYRMKQ